MSEQQNEEERNGSRKLIELLNELRVALPGVLHLREGDRSRRRVARCDAPASFPGFASWPLSSVRCRRGDASTRRVGFSVCWMRIDGEPSPSEELRLPGVRWRDLAKAGT